MAQMAMTDYLANALLDHVFKGAAFSQPANLYVGLSTTAIADAGTGATEPGAGGYTRSNISTFGNFWSAAASRALVNDLGRITFPVLTGAWGTLTWAFISDAAAAGNMLFKGALTLPVTPAVGETPEFDLNTMTITLTASS